MLSSILNRTSVRKFLTKEVEQEKISELLKCGMAAPSAMNKQPWKFMVIEDKEILNLLAETMEHGKMLSTCPLAIAVIGDLSLACSGNLRDYWIQDCSAATQNILLAAHEMGLGSVWCGVYPGAENKEKIQEVLNCPDEMIVLNIIAIGYPAKEYVAKNKFKQENIIHNRF